MQKKGKPCKAQPMIGPGIRAMNTDQNKQRRSHARRAKALGKMMG